MLFILLSSLGIYSARWVTIINHTTLAPSVALHKRSGGSACDHRDLEDAGARVVRPMSKNDEERAGISVSGLEKTTSLFPSKASEQIQTLVNSGRLLDDVFTTLKLTQTEDKLFDNSVAWLKYVDEFNEKNPEKSEESRGDQTSCYQVASGSDAWLVEKETSPYSILKLLELDFKSRAKERQHLLTTPGFTTWFKYVSMFNKQNPNKQETAAFILLGRYNIINVMDMVKVAQQHPSSARIANIIQAQLVKRYDKSPIEVFKLLQLENIPVGSNILAQREFRVWTKFLDGFNKKNPDRKEI
ncbi:Avirulence protein (Avh) [Phytophthora palmivora]|uniref:Avirulence protein (Avh) n=1 Tax=Phytophthora palmivora TaxID=4796 RepID=A0A2P4XJH6_9STRA|nr:Avirulence protein (Avh) [Phytophthora palmivora]